MVNNLLCKQKTTKNKKRHPLCCFWLVCFNHGTEGNQDKSLNPICSVLVKRRETERQKQLEEATWRPTERIMLKKQQRPENAGDHYQPARGKQDLQRKDSPVGISLLAFYSPHVWKQMYVDFRYHMVTFYNNPRGHLSHSNGNSKLFK